MDNLSLEIDKEDYSFTNFHKIKSLAYVNK